MPLELDIGVNTGLFVAFASVCVFSFAMGILATHIWWRS